MFFLKIVYVARTGQNPIAGPSCEPEHAQQPVVYTGISLSSLVSTAQVFLVINEPADSFCNNKK